MPNFWIVFSQGGQHNDGYTLKFEAKLESNDELLELLDMMDIDYSLHPSEPIAPNLLTHMDICLKLRFSNGERWIKTQHFPMLFGYRVYMEIHEKYILLNLNQTCWYSVSLEAVKNSLKIEEKLISNEKFPVKYIWKIL